MEALFGLEPGAFGGSREEYIAHVHPDDRERVGNAIAAALTEEAALVHEHRVVWPDGSVHWLEGRGHVVRDSRGTIVGMIGVGIDIDARKERELLFAVYEADVQRMYRRLQTGLMPPFELDGRMIVESLYEPGEGRLLLGGDFLDAVSLDDGALALVIGDVSGHGPDAAALGARLRAAWRALALRHGGHSDVVATLDQLLRQEARDAETFATLVYAVVSPDQRALEIALAGHPAPLLLSGGRAEVVDAPPNPPLGVITAPCVPVHVTLPEPWALLLFTDGIVEGRADPGSVDRFGVERLVAEAAGAFDGATREGLAQLLRSAEEANGAPLPDDVALLFVAPPRG
jgi:PAS domain S-box-containing protein